MHASWTEPAYDLAGFEINWIKKEMAVTTIVNLFAATVWSGSSASPLLKNDKSVEFKSWHQRSWLLIHVQMFYGGEAVCLGNHCTQIYSDRNVNYPCWISIPSETTPSPRYWLRASAAGYADVIDKKTKHREAPFAVFLYPGGVVNCVIGRSVKRMCPLN